MSREKWMNVIDVACYALRAYSFLQFAECTMKHEWQHRKSRYEAREAMRLARESIRKAIEWFDDQCDDERVNGTDLLPNLMEANAAAIAASSLIWRSGNARDFIDDAIRNASRARSALFPTLPQWRRDGIATESTEGGVDQ